MTVVPENVSGRPYRRLRQFRDGNRGELFSVTVLIVAVVVLFDTLLSALDRVVAR